jgi:hypothetical protein
MNTTKQGSVDLSGLEIAGVNMERLMRNLDETSYNEGSHDLACRLSDCREVIKALLTKAAQPAAGQVPEGWQLVPRIATPEMLLAYSENVDGLDRDTALDDWIAMLAAAPVPPVPAAAAEQAGTFGASAVLTPEYQAEQQAKNTAARAMLDHLARQAQAGERRYTQDEVETVVRGALASQRERQAQAGAVVAGDDDLKSWPARIFLQHQFEYTPNYEVAYKACNEITWCQNKQDRYDVEYVRADLAAPTLGSAPQAEPVAQEGEQIDGYGETLRECAAMLGMSDDDDLLDITQFLSLALKASNCHPISTDASAHKGADK